MILIISNKWDITVDFVISELRQRGCGFIRINTEDLVLGRATINIPNLEILVEKQGKVIDLAKVVKVIWNRRPGKPFDNLPEESVPSLPYQHFINDQWFSWQEVLQLIPNVKWINHPQANYLMENKIRQLMIAAKLGFSIPDTVVTNDPEDIKFLAKKHNERIIAKALYSPLIEEKGQDFFVFTNEVTITDLSPVEDFRISPSIFQQTLSPKIDYRVTVVDNEVFAVKVQDQINPMGGHIDWRTKKEGLTFISCKLPVEIEFLCKKFVQECGLFFGALDLVQYKNKFYFLEINPNGEWGWLQYPYGIPIAKALADLMIRLGRS
ncbi:MAG: hypothetical protein ACYDH1_10195 [Anaerolineaceae bacterium]